MLDLSRFFRRRTSSEPADLGEFLRAQSAFVAQKTVLDYCRVKAGRSEKKLFADPDFQAALQHCRWQVYFAALSDVSALLFQHLRGAAPGREQALAGAIAGLHHAALAAEPPPAGELADGVADAAARRLATLAQEDPVPAHRLPLEAEPVLFATLPIHADQRVGEAPAIRGALRFHIVTTQQELERRFHGAGLVTRLLPDVMS
jgi:hypothetical protein